MRASSMGRFVVTAALLVGSGACSQVQVVTTPRSFDRPGRTSLVCFDVTVTPPVAVALAQCAPADPAVGTLPTGRDLHAIVLQSRRGEIAVVNLRTNAILDTNRTIPGYTFVEAGALPVDIVSTTGLTADSQITTYVANSGTEDIWVFAASKFRAPATTESAETMRVELGPNGAPSAVALTPDERFLIVALPMLGVLRQFPIDPVDGSLGPPLPDIALATDVPEPLAAEPEADLYERVCSAATLGRPTAAPERIARGAGTAPSPTVLVVDAVDAARWELFVGDASLPVVHRFPIDEFGVGAEAAPLAIGTPVRDLALTPFVPRTVDVPAPGLDTDRRYLYVLDDTGAVAVMDLSDPDAFPNGRPLSIEIPTARQQDRISFPAPANALTIVATPDYDPANPNPCALDNVTPQTRGPARLHGVFLVASLTDGTVRFIDVYDRDAACRGNANLCAGTTTSTVGDSIVYVRRHRPRVGLLVTNEIGVIGTPTMSTGGVAFAIDEDGQASSGSVPDLMPLTDCASGTSFVKAYPREELAPLVCGVGDPWAATQERWTATYEGTILSGAAGRFDDDPIPSSFVAGTTNFCRAGVLGTVGAVDLPGPGDQLVITGDLPPGTLTENPDCAKFVANDPATGARVIVAFEIIDADDAGNLVIGDATLGAPFASRVEVATCFPELVTFEVRSRASWVVRGAFSGLVRPTPTVMGNCRRPVVPPPPALDPNAGLTFRAYSGLPFVSRALAFQIDPLVPATPGMALSFDLGGLPAALGVDLTPGTVSGSIPVDMFYSSFENKLYAVDAGRAALTRIALENVTVERLFQ